LRRRALSLQKINPKTEQSTMARRIPKKQAKHSGVNAVHYFKQSYNADFTVFGDADPSPGGATVILPSLSSAPDVAHLTSLFDEFRIDRVKVTFTPAGNQTFIAGAVEPMGGTNPIFRVPNIHTAVDYGKSSPPGSVSDMQQYGTYKRAALLQPVTVSFVPKAQVALCNPGSTGISGYQVVAAGWLDAQNAGIRLAGLQVYVDSPTSESLTAGNPYLVKTNVELQLSFRNQI
jgi:hypothetical protein